MKSKECLNTLHSLGAALVIAAVLLTPSSTFAGTITVVNLPASGTDAATGINPTNTYLLCLDFGNNASPPGNINGVPFIHPDLGNQTVNTTNGVDGNHGGTYAITTGGSAACMIGRVTSTTPAGQADGNTWKMLNDTIYTGSSAPVNSWLNQTYGGLTFANQYTLRIYYRQWAADIRTINISFDGEGTPQSYSGNPLNQDAGGAHYIKYVFTAVKPNVFVGMTNLIANGSAMVYCVTLEQAGGPPAPPAITVLPVGGTNVPGASFSMNIAASGAPPLAYQWYKDGVAVAGATGTGVALTSLSVTNAGSYKVIVTNAYGTATSSVALLVVAASPNITAQPVGGTNTPGANFSLSVAGSGAVPLTYQWYKDGGAIAGATNTTLALGYLRLSDAGSYRAIVTNTYGAATSGVASLVVAGAIPPPPDFTQTDAALVAAAGQAVALATASDTNQAVASFSAHWVSPAASSINLWLCYRKTFTLPSQPASAVARIATDSKYWLWVNGQMVVREGELRRAPNPVDTWYDQLDLAPFLQAGSNTIAVLQCHFGKTGFSHTNSGTAGFLFEMNADGMMVHSDTSWRMITNSAFQLATSVPQPNSRISESSLRYDARLGLGGWTNQNFDDSGWSNPIDRGPVGDGIWGNLWQRSLPFWQELPLQNFVSTSISGSAPVVWTCYLPVNEQFTPWLDVSNASSGQLITIVPDTVANTASPGHEYVTRAGRQSFEFPAWISGHYVKFSIPSGVTVYGLRFRPHLANTTRYGSFDCDDTNLVTLWNKAANTLGVNMMDDWGETRERANWIGDSSVILGQAPYSYDRLANLISRKCLLELIHWQRTDNTMFAPAPANYKELPVQLLAALGNYGVWRYYRDTGDLPLLQQCYPAIKSYLLNVWQTDSQGLVVHRVGQWDWEDWGDNIDPPLLDNAWYLLALEAAAQMAPLVGQPLDVASFQSRAQGIRHQFNTSFWTGSGYRSSAYSGNTDERGNAMAVLAGLSSPSQAAALRTVLINQQHCSPYMEKYVIEALFALGYPDDALARMRSRYSAMISNSATTLWELFPASGGFNHGWSGGPLPLLDEYVAGVTNTSLGFATFDVRPMLGNTLSRAQANVPSPYGIIAISAARDGADYRLSVRVPPGSSGRAFQPASGGLLSGAALSIDGGATAVMDDTASPSDINVTGGNATSVTNVVSTGTLNKTGSGNLYIGSATLLAVGGFEAVAGQTIVSVGGLLIVTNSGGHITVQSGATLANAGGSITCSSLNVAGTFEETSDGVLTVGGSVTNQGTLRLLGTAQLNVSGTFINNGVLDIMTWNGFLPAGFTNWGTLLDRNAIKVESCEVKGGNIELMITGYSNHTYQLQGSNALRPATWINIGSPQVGTGKTLEFADRMGGDVKFYRVAVY